MRQGKRPKISAGLAFDGVVCALLIICLQFASVGAALTCVKENGDPVDWFVVYKLPRVSGSPNKLINNGTAYLYWTSDMGSADDDWLLSNISITSEASLPGRTLSKLYANSNLSSLVFMYNDEFPNGTTTFTLGHTKGVIAADLLQGFWMIHSAPRFPVSPADAQGYSYPLTATVFGQTLMCITLRTDDIDPIGSQMKFMAPYVYHWSIDAQLKDRLPNLVDAVQGKPRREPPWFQSHEFSSNQGFRFRSFAKAKQFDKDLYADWLAPALSTSLAVETWQNGEGKVMPSACNNTFTTENIKEINVTVTVFKSHRDHSKWAVALDQKSPWLCIGDINRMESQKKRAGGSVCFMHEMLWSKFFRGAAVVEPCPIFHPKSPAASTGPSLYIQLLFPLFTLLVLV